MRSRWGGWDPYDEELVAPEIPAPPAMPPAAAKKLTKKAANCPVLKALPAKFWRNVFVQHPARNAGHCLTSAP